MRTIITLFLFTIASASSGDELPPEQTEVANMQDRVAAWEDCVKSAAQFYGRHSCMPVDQLISASLGKCDAVEQTMIHFREDAQMTRGIAVSLEEDARTRMNKIMTSRILDNQIARGCAK